MGAQNTAGTAGVTGMSIRSTGTSGPWIPMNDNFGADWEIAASPAQPLDALITADDGSSVSSPSQPPPPPPPPPTLWA